MAHTYSSIYFHYIFSTKNQQKIIRDDLQERLWAYMGGIARENHMNALSIGGGKTMYICFCPCPPGFWFLKPFN